MKASLVADPTVMVKLVLTAAVSAPEVAVSVYVPALSMPQPAKVATPETALMGLAVQVRVAPPAVVMARVTGAVLVATVLPPASWTVTTGWAPNAVPPVELEGSVVTSSWVAGPTVMTKLVLSAAVSVPEVAVSVYVPVRSTPQPPKVATPDTALRGLAVQVTVAPAGVVMLRVT